jgi:uncharacterized protein (DUF2384 family)
MNARLRKKKLYRQALNTLAFDQALFSLTKSQYGNEWSAIEAEILRAFGDDRLTAWIRFISPAVALDGRRPVDLVATGNRHLVQEHLTRLEYGVYT